ncbi:hypothetical protein C8R45DRAFT_1216886 [Mycena sanguinolenta]|nr:hypothetical protein C8R45DRAFT_1216886 [Mycena sanguinolenta]
MLPPELVKIIVDYGWGCLTTSSHQHGLSMTRWMLVSRDWLNIVLPVVFRDLWITSYAHLEYILDICHSNVSFVCGLAGISNIRQHLIRISRSLTISAYHGFQGEYTGLCTQLVECATTDRHPEQRLSRRYRFHNFAMYTRSISPFVVDYTPDITSLHFVLIDCTATYRPWDTQLLVQPYFLKQELHVTFAYTSPPPALLMDAPRGTFFPPPSRYDMPWECCFQGVQKLVVRDANTDLVAFLTTACPRLKTIESTAEFSREDVPQDVPAAVQDSLEFVRLPRTVNWGLAGGTDALPLPKQGPPAKQSVPPAPSTSALPPATPSPSPVRKRRNLVWRFLKHAKRVLWEQK